MGACPHWPHTWTWQRASLEARMAKLLPFTRAFRLSLLWTFPSCGWLWPLSLASLILIIVAKQAPLLCIVRQWENRNPAMNLGWRVLKLRVHLRPLASWSQEQDRNKRTVGHLWTNYLSSNFITHSTLPTAQLRGFHHCLLAGRWIQPRSSCPWVFHRLFQFGIFL